MVILIVIGKIGSGKKTFIKKYLQENNIQSIHYIDKIKTKSNNLQLLNTFCCLKLPTKKAVAENQLLQLTWQQH